MSSRIVGGTGAERNSPAVWRYSRARGMRSPVRGGRAAIHEGMAARHKLSDSAALAKRRE